MAIVSARKIDCYAPDALASAVDALLAPLPLANDLKPGMRVLIKPNLVAAHKPDGAVTTHPALLRAVIEAVRACGVTDIVLADSPGGPYSAQALRGIYRACGMDSLADIAALNYDCTFSAVPCPAGFSVRTFNLIAPVLQADYIINCAKLKTHGMTRLSAGIKNLFGTIPGLQKPEMHYRFPALDDFSRMLVELSQVVRPGLTILDAIDCMEGNGPTAGAKRHLGALFASENMYAQDYLAASIMGIDASQVAMLNIAREMKLFDKNDITLVGDAIPAADPPFLLPETKRLDFTSHIPALLRRPAQALLTRVLRPVPHVDHARCVGCGKCAESCSPHAMTIIGGKAHFDRKKCISCFCCQEMCPQKIIGVRRMLHL